jgi:hypothetical protein
MGEFLHSLVKELRTREQFLEDHSTRIATEEPPAPVEHGKELGGLRDMLKAVSRRVAALDEGEGSEWEVSKESLHRDLEALDKEIHDWIRKTT